MRSSDWSSDVCSSDLNNPLAIFREPISLDEVMASKRLYGPITRFQACPPTCGAAAAILVSPAFAAKNGLDAPVEIVAQSMTTDYAGTFEGRRSEEHTSELQSLMRISYAVFCLKKKKSKKIVPENLTDK